jgi:hypothetical protein
MVNHKDSEGECHEQHHPEHHCRLAVGAMLVGCGGPSEPKAAAITPKPTPSPSVVTPTLPVIPTPAASTTPTVLTIAQAGKVYLAAVGPSNATADKFSADYQAGASMKKLRADAVKALKARRHFLEVLDNTVWPKVVAKNAADLTACVAEDVAWFDANTRLTRRSDLTPVPTCGTSDSQLIRVRLHLSAKTS